MNRKIASFADRHIGLADQDQAQMLEYLGEQDLEEFIARAVPETIRIDEPPALPAAQLDNVPDRPLSETEALQALQQFAGMGSGAKSMIGQGYYGCLMPEVVKRRILENPAWYTAYTPYQPEISQGRLEMLVNFQTMVASLCGLPMANASLLDEATAAAEAMTLLKRVHKGEGSRLLVDADTLPQTLAVLQTRADSLGIEIVSCSDDSQFDTAGAFGALLSVPGCSGAVKDRSELIASLQEKGVRTAVCTDLLALCLIKSPGAMGASVAVGSSQRFGLPMGAGGPHAGFIAFAEDLVRQVPGRIVGISKDQAGRPGLRLALQTREQHIRRAKATSNICTAQVLPAIISAAYAIYHGPEGLAGIAAHAHGQACRIAAAASAAGLQLASEDFFDTLRIACDDPGKVVERAARDGVDILAGDGHVCLSTDETTSDADVGAILDALGIEPAGSIKLELAAALRREDEFLTQPVFSEYHSEHELLRYLRRLASKDISLDRSMIPLGSCTMKLNAATEMVALSWPGFADLHPFAPAASQRGINALADDLACLLATLTGFDAVSLQPNAGSQSEYAGLLAIRGYQRDNGQGHRDMCLIPESAHGTNPASAVMAGMEVVPVAIDATGEVDLDDLAAKAQKHQERLAALMITYPSTCGVYGPRIREICAIVHDNGGQVYMDGANLNALVGCALPGRFGPDVMHINLHKTFCIPHGGGGPGMGPLACLGHLEPYLPGHHAAPSGRTDGAVSAAPLGSGILLLISWAYIRMMGAAGLRKATAAAVLAANYMAKRLREGYELAFVDADSMVAHEFIIDGRAFKKSAGVTVDDIAKRLIDFGFHAPTVSFPLAGAIMIEPTESESLAELDRFCAALLKIREEISSIEQGTSAREDNPLVNAPHVAADLLADDYRAGYSRQAAAYPLDWIRSDKYWPPVARVDQVFGDRNLRCVLEAGERLP